MTFVYLQTASLSLHLDPWSSAIALNAPMSSALYTGDRGSLHSPDVRRQISKHLFVNDSILKLQSPWLVRTSAEPCDLTHNLCITYVIQVPLSCFFVSFPLRFTSTFCFNFCVLSPPSPLLLVFRGEGIKWSNGFEWNVYACSNWKRALFWGRSPRERCGPMKRGSVVR